MLVVVEGNVQSGRSTLLRRLSAGGVRTVPAPECWASFAHDPAFLRCAVQAWYALVARSLALLPKASIVYVEGAPSSPCAVFARRARAARPTLSCAEARLRLRAQKLWPPPAVHVFLLTTGPSECHARSVRASRGVTYVRVREEGQRLWTRAFRLRAKGLRVCVV